MCKVPVAAETGRKLQQPMVCLLWWESLPVPTEAGAGVWGESPGCRLRPLHTTQQWCLVSKADHASSRSIPGHGAPHSCPRSPSLPSPQVFSKQPIAVFSLIHSPNPTLQRSAPATIGRFLSQAGAPRADSQGGFGMRGMCGPTGACAANGGFGSVSAQDPEACID